MFNMVDHKRPASASFDGVANARGALRMGASGVHPRLAFRNPHPLSPLKVSFSSGDRWGVDEDEGVHFDYSSLSPRPDPQPQERGWMLPTALIASLLSLALSVNHSMTGHAQNAAMNSRQSYPTQDDQRMLSSEQLDYIAAILVQRPEFRQAVSDQASTDQVLRLIDEQKRLLDSSGVRTEEELRVLRENNEQLRREVAALTAKVAELEKNSQRGINFGWRLGF